MIFLTFFIQKILSATKILKNEMKFLPSNDSYQYLTRLQILIMNETNIFQLNQHDEKLQIFNEVNNIKLDRNF